MCTWTNEVTSVIQTKQTHTLEVLFSDSIELCSLVVVCIKVSSMYWKIISYYIDKPEVAAPQTQICGSELELATVTECASGPPGMLTQAHPESDSPQHSGLGKQIKLLWLSVLMVCL